MTTLIGCGVLADEVRAVITDLAVPVTARFLPARLHVRLGRLERGLAQALAVSPEPATVVYGACHPRMDDIVAANGARRTPGQNCLEILLGPELFAEHLQAGAYFLLAHWAGDWEWMVQESFGPYPDVVREIFQVSHRYLLGVRTPASADFGAAADSISEQVGLPLRWIDVGLEHLRERLLEATSHDPSRAGTTGGRAAPSLHTCARCGVLR